MRAILPAWKLPRSVPLCQTQLPSLDMGTWQPQLCLGQCWTSMYLNHLSFDTVCRIGSEVARPGLVVADHSFLCSV